MPDNGLTHLGFLPFQVSGYDSISRAVTAAGRPNADHVALGIKFVAAEQSHGHRVINRLRLLRLVWRSADVRVITQELAEKLSRVLGVLCCKLPQRGQVARLYLPASLLWPLGLIEVRVSTEVAIVRMRNLPATHCS